MANLLRPETSANDFPDDQTMTGNAVKNFAEGASANANDNATTRSKYATTGNGWRFKYFNGDIIVLG